MNNVLTVKQKIVDILLEHPDSFVYKLGSAIDKYKINWNGRNFYID